MTNLYERLFPDDGADNIPIHAFHAAIVDYMAGHTTRTQIVNAWALDAEAQADLDVLLAAVNALPALNDKLRFITEMDAVNKLAAADLKYNTRAAYATRLGLS